MADLKFPKPRPAALQRQDRRKALKKADASENDKVRCRSQGRCEAVELHLNTWSKFGSSTATRCERRAIHFHHRLSGIGVRGRGKSALAQWKYHLCQKCHSDIHAHILVPDGDYFRRVK